MSKNSKLSESGVLVVIGGIFICSLINNWHNLTFLRLVLILIVSFIILAGVSCFMIFTPWGQKLDGGKTKDLYDKEMNKKE